MSIIYGNVKPTFMEIYPDWKYITTHSPYKTVLKAGTPISANGRIANNDGAIGLVAENTGVSDNPISIIVGGAVSLTAVQSSYTTLTTACKNALKGILFINASGKVDVSGEVPVAGSGDKDKYLHTNASTGAMEWASVSGGGGVTTLYYDTSYIYDTNNFWTDRTMMDIVTFADAAAMVAANPGAVVFAEVGNTYLPAHAVSDGTYGISFVALMAQGGGYAVATISSDYGYSSIVPHTFNEGGGISDGEQIDGGL